MLELMINQNRLRYLIITTTDTEKKELLMTFQNDAILDKRKLSKLSSRELYELFGFEHNIQFSSKEEAQIFMEEHKELIIGQSVIISNKLYTKLDVITEEELSYPREYDIRAFKLLFDKNKDKLLKSYELSLKYDIKSYLDDNFFLTNAGLRWTIEKYEKVTGNKIDYPLKDKEPDIPF